MTGICLTVSAIVVVSWYFNSQAARSRLITPMVDIPAEPARPDPAVPLLLTRSDLEPFFTDQHIGLLATRVAERLPQYADWWREVAGFANRCTLDVILQTHEYPGIGPTEMAAIQKKQRRIVELLDYLRPNLIGDEGHDLDTLNLTTCEQSVIDYARQSGQPFDPIEIHQLVLADTASDPMLIYLRHHPTARIIGYEDNDLNALHYTALGLIGPSQTGADYESLHYKLASTRSFVALVRVLKTMRHEHRLHGALIIGYRHSADLESLCRRLGLRRRFYNLS
jgi:hypothetical protein